MKATQGAGRPGPPFQVEPSRSDEVTRVMCAAFHDYPVMRYVVGVEGDEYEDRLWALVNYFVLARILQGHPVLAIETSGLMTAATTLTSPGVHEEPAEVATLRESVWAKLGQPAHARYGKLCTIWDRFWLREPHYHVNMIGVLPEQQGRGLARVLLEHVHSLSRQHPQSRGVSLTTELPANVRLYEHFGYRVVDRERVELDLESWGLFRPEVRE